MCVSDKVDRADDIMKTSRRGVYIAEGPQYITHHDGDYIVWSSEGLDSDKETKVDKSVLGEDEVRDKIRWWFENENIEPKEAKFPRMSKLSKDNRIIFNCVVVSDI